MTNAFAGTPLDVGCLLAAAVFVAHIAGNLALSRPGGSMPPRLDGLSLFPPAWVFAIWLAIWGLQAALLVQTYATGFWTPPITALFLLICVGNFGSQWAGAKDWGGAIYLGLLGLMLGASVLFWQVGGQVAGVPRVFQVASQLYVGWACVALVVGLGVVLVCDQKLVADATYSWVGLALLVAAAIAIWVVWGRGGADYRVVSAPCLLVLIALALRVTRDGGAFVRSSRPRG